MDIPRICVSKKTVLTFLKRLGLLSDLIPLDFRRFQISEKG